MFCMICGSNCCYHIATVRSVGLSFREVSLLHALANPTLHGTKDMARSLGVTPGTFKVYQSRILDKLDWSHGSNSQRLLTLWALAHSIDLGIRWPTPEQFPPLNERGGLLVPCPERPAP